MAETAFELSEEQPAAGQVFVVDGKFLAIAFKARQQADMTKLDDETSAELKKVLLTSKKERLLENRIQELREKADIDIHPALQNSIKGEVSS